MDETSSSPASIPITVPVADALLGAWIDFLTIALHSLLYHRGIYPRRTFLTARAFGTVVHQSRHPAVVSWIRSAVDAIRDQIRTGTVERVVLVLYADIPPPAAAPPTVSVVLPSDSSAATIPPKTSAGSAKNKHRTSTSILKKPAQNTTATATTSPANHTGAQRTPPVAERWVFNTSMFPIFPLVAPSATAVTTADAGNTADLDPAQDPVQDPADALADAIAEQINWTDVDEQLRAALQRISHAADKIPPLAEGATFTLAVEMREDAPAPIGHPQPWIPSELNSQAAGLVNASNTTPIRSVAAGPLFFECWLEQATPS